MSDTTAIAIPPSDMELLRNCQHWAPHEFYGWHPLADGGSVVRTRQINAQKVEFLSGDTAEDMIPLGDDLWALRLDTDTAVDYRYRVTWPDQEPVTLADPYTFLPTIGETDLYLIGEGRHERLWEVLGAHVKHYDAVTGTAFTVWAPNAKGVAVVGDFNGWNCSQHPMRSMGSSGIWEIFLPDVRAGAHYKFAIQTPEGVRIDKADPMARRTEEPPATASIVTEESYEWQDSEWIARRDLAHSEAQPMSIYEVHLGSWKEGLNYEQLATELVDYVADHHFTHVEFMPVSEHPFGGSWGYQVSGYYAPTARWGTPEQLRTLIDAFHQRGIGVIMDWVPGHFPKDDWALARFDGRPLYEHPDWRRGEQRDWGTYVFNWGRNEVRNFLFANALYWVEEFHIDGLRVDAVASMLYLDYSREDGEWLPNQYGGRENLEAVQFLQETNATVHKHFPGVLTIAEESTSWPGVTAATKDGGLGFNLKWNMGWMNDTLEYFSEDPVNRKYHHNEITFSMVYAYSEKFILPFSHDEVVHGKGSLWGRLPGDAWNKAAGLRTLYGYMFSHPGKTLIFQGQEFGQPTEWSEAHSIQWDCKEGWEGEYHRGVDKLITDLNRVVAEHPALYARDFSPEGFVWVKGDDADHNILAYTRWAPTGEGILAIMNLGGTSYPDYTVGMPFEGTWELILNTDDAAYEGAGNPLAQTVSTQPREWDGQHNSLTVHVPAMSCQYYLLKR